MGCANDWFWRFGNRRWGMGPAARGEMAHIRWQTSACNHTRPCPADRTTPGQQPAGGSDSMAQDSHRGGAERAVAVTAAFGAVGGGGVGVLSARGSKPVRLRWVLG